MPNTFHDRYKYWRKKHPEPNVPDFDSMTDEQIRSWLDAIPRGAYTRHGEAAHRFPGCPPGYATAHRILEAIAHHKIRNRNFGELYRRLPPWAKWRERLPVEACILPGKKFRKSPPRGDNPLNLLKGLTGDDKGRTAIHSRKK